MISSITNFLHRHRRKFIYASLLGGGFLCATKYAEKKLHDWQEQQTSILLEKQKRRQHFDSNKRTACTTALSLSNTLKEIIVTELDSDSLLLAIRENPETKHVTWEKLKCVAFSRVLCTIYTSSLVTCSVHTQLMLLGGYVYGDLINDGHAGVTINQELQQKYLLTIRDLVTNGMVALINNVEKAVDQVVSELPLTKLIDLKYLETILQEIVLCLKGENAPKGAYGNPVNIPTWSHFMTKKEFDDKQDTNLVYNNMITETIGVMDGNDFHTVVDALIQQSLNLFLDDIADYFPSNVNILEQTMPVAKLVPILCNIIHSSYSSAPTHLVQKLSMNDQLESFSYNIYEGFSVPLIKEC